MYQPRRVFEWLGAVFALIGLAAEARFLYYFLSHRGSGHIQSVIIGGVFLMIGFFCILAGIIADLIASNRKLLEEALYRVRRLEGGRYRSAD
jgi:hypothetical protein